MASLKYLDPITGEYKKVASGGGGTSIPASDTEPASGNYWLDTSAEGGTYYTAGEIDNMMAALPAGVQMDLLWENPNPSAEFAAQTITLDNNSFQEFVVVIRNSSGGNYPLYMAYPDSKTNFAVTHGNTSPTTGDIFTFARTLTVNGNTEFVFTDAVSLTNSSTYNNFMCPYNIYVIKSTVTGGTSVTPENVYTKDEIDELLANVGGGMGMDLLWENEDPTVAFAAQTVEFGNSLLNYSHAFVEYRLQIGMEYSIPGGIFQIYSGAKIRQAYPHTTNMLREMTVTSTGVEFTDAIEYTSYNNTTNVKCNTFLIPYRIYGIKAVSSNSASETEDPDHPGCFYRTVNGVQEWLNPPMELGVEYKTTERYLGKPVYVKTFDCGALPDGNKNTVTDIENYDSIVGISGYAFDPGNGSRLALSYVGTITDYVFISWANGKIVTHTAGSWSNWPNHNVTVKYTKTTD